MARSCFNCGENYPLDDGGWCKDCRKAWVEQASPSPDEQTTDGLLPCPLCGGAAEVIEEDQFVDCASFHYAVVSCKSCYCRTGRVRGQKEKREAFAIAAWNRRTPAQAADVDKVLAEMRQALLDLAGYVDCWCDNYQSGRTCAYCKAIMILDETKKATGGNE